MQRGERIAPTLGVQAGFGRRFVSKASPGAAVVPYVGADLGVELPQLLDVWIPGASVGVRRDLSTVRVKRGSEGTLHTLDPLSMVVYLSLARGIE